MAPYLKVQFRAHANNELGGRCLLLPTEDVLRIGPVLLIDLLRPNHRHLGIFGANRTSKSSRSRGGIGSE